MAYKSGLCFNCLEEGQANKCPKPKKKRKLMVAQIKALTYGLTQETAESQDKSGSDEFDATTPEKPEHWPDFQ
ncbi:hypothetical protein HKX48_007167 [Thoreauomyces humboldtii]|nr:hypothetical protein HKX48_007167 [Thoreauomyces humboldtii]